MVREILTVAGFVENKTFKETRFLKPPKSTNAVFMDSINKRGSDDKNLITEHDYTIELYEYKPDPISEKKIEDALDLYGIPYTKEARYWINTEQLYQTIYSFSYIEK